MIQECEHLRRAPAGAEQVPARTPDGCQECLELGNTAREWVHLRLCLACGHVGCCDSSAHQHASAHAAATGHPVVRSYEAGETWRWCYVDEVLDAS